MRLVLIAFGCALLAAYPGCDADGSAGTSGLSRITVASWNAQALFDGKDDGVEYADFSAASGWSEGAYRRRLSTMASAVAAMADGGPDILALIEIENEGVAREIAADVLSGMGYRWTAFAANPGAALGIAVLSRFPIADFRAHGAAVSGAETPRPALEVRVDADGAPLVLLVCHWKSKLGGARETESLRRSSASVLARRLESLRRDEPDAAVLALGDFNENDDEFGRVGGAYPTALLPDTAEARASLESDRTAPLLGPPLVVVGGKPPAAAEVPGAVALFSPWSGSLWAGSYAYKGEWERIDHILSASSLFDGEGWDFDVFRVADLAPMTNAAGYPDAYNPRTGKGCSDHLPVVVELVRR